MICLFLTVYHGTVGLHVSKLAFTLVGFNYSQIVIKTFCARNAHNHTSWDCVISNPANFVKESGKVNNLVILVTQNSNDNLILRKTVHIQIFKVLWDRLPKVNSFK